MRNTRVTDCRTVPRSPERVWDALTDFARYPAWWPASLRVRVLRVSPGLVGSRFEVRPWGSRFVCEVGAVVPGREMVVRYVEGAHRGTGVWTLRPDGAGTRVCYVVDLEPCGPLPRLLSHVLDFGRIHSAGMAQLFDGLEGWLVRGRPPAD